MFAWEKQTDTWTESFDSWLKASCKKNSITRMNNQLKDFKETKKGFMPQSLFDRPVTIIKKDK